MSEFRQDIVSGDWIIVVPSRGSRPHDFSKNKKKRTPTSKSSCPFEDLKRSGNWPPISVYPSSSTKNWKTVVIPNKYPAISKGEKCVIDSSDGLYSKFDGSGRHELVVTSSHTKSFPDLNPEDALQVFKAFKDRYVASAHDSCVEYLSIFANWGPSAGASLYHPHYQMLGLPIIPPKAVRSLEGSKKYFKKNNSCAHCDIIDFEKKAKERIVIKNKNAIAIAPFTPANDYEVRVFPKKHVSKFEDSSNATLADVADLLQQVLKAIKKKLGDPDYNFFIHTAPSKNSSKHATYHWHIEIIPKISTFAGFELSTGVDINTAPPESVAKLLRAGLK